MSHREVGQLTMVDGLCSLHESVYEFDDLLEIFDWSEIEGELSEIYSSKRGCPSYPPLMMFKALLLQQWYDLSDYGLESHLGRDLLFKRFVGLGLDDKVPDHSTICRFRGELKYHQRLERLFTIIQTQIDDRGLLIKQGTLMDASIIEAPNGRGKGKQKDKEARGTVKNDKPHYGYKLHVGVDKDSALIRKVHVTTAEVYDGRVQDRLISGDEQAIFADKAYHSKKRLQEARKSGLYYGTLRRQKAKNLPNDYNRKEKVNRKLRAPVERIFAVLKIHMGRTHTRYMGLMKNKVHLTLSCIAYNLKRTQKLMQLQTN